MCIACKIAQNIRRVHTSQIIYDFLDIVGAICMSLRALVKSGRESDQVLGLLLGHLLSLLQHDTVKVFKPEKHTDGVDFPAESGEDARC